MADNFVADLGSPQEFHRLHIGGRIAYGVAFQYGAFDSGAVELLGTRLMDIPLGQRLGLTDGRYSEQWIFVRPFTDGLQEIIAALVGLANQGEDSIMNYPPQVMILVSVRIFNSY